MKRINNLYDKIYSLDNLRIAEKKARKGKTFQHGIKVFDRNYDNNLFILHEMLKNKTYTTSEYTTFKVYEPKEREIFRLPYFPDRIAHHAIMNILEPIFKSMFTSDTYSCIKGKGIHAALNSVREALKDVNATRYCLKLDIKKFYPNIDHTILSQLLRKKFKDSDLLLLLDGIIESAKGVPIGNYLSQYFANFYLTYFDHWIKEKMSVKDYFRYADDIVIFSDNKPYLHDLLDKIRDYFKTELNLIIKENYQIFPVESRGVDFVGYVCRHDYIKLRKSIKKNFARMICKRKNRLSIASYNGWISHCNGKNLLKKLLHEKV